MGLVNQGKIDAKDVIERTQTANFPAGAATVRLAKVREKHPFVTVHIRGKSDIRTRPWGSYDDMMKKLADEKRKKYGTTCSYNGY